MKSETDYSNDCEDISSSEDIDALVEISLRGLSAGKNAAPKTAKKWNKSVPEVLVPSLNRSNVRSLESGLDQQLYIEDSGTAKIIDVEATRAQKITNSIRSDAPPLFKKKREDRVIAGGGKVLGKGWFGYRGAEPSKELQRDIDVIKMRSYLDPQRFYKASEIGNRGIGLQQVGTVVEAPNEFFSSRLTKRQRRRTVVDELMSDQNIKNYVRSKALKLSTEKGKKASSKKFKFIARKKQPRKNRKQV
eukprot:CAMPEP_0171452850 /NCGR_PEP_ID=MMETSP0945-20130129/794_1 /TAXON_ID=109269 /ORGANISM="Vaucheria litorea, Strain CCMP2940" /LENGTH=246 /DNA_ID=CAMNT_0011977601 /DNA_START=111 /DNA_END=851 /DNA_ORIENTATION=+